MRWTLKVKTLGSQCRWRSWTKLDLDADARKLLPLLMPASVQEERMRILTSSFHPYQSNSCGCLTSLVFPYLSLSPCSSMSPLYHIWPLLHPCHFLPLLGCLKDALRSC